MLLLVALIAVSAFAAKEHHERRPLGAELIFAEDSNDKLVHHLHHYIQGLPPAVSQKLVDEAAHKAATAVGRP